MTGTTQAAPRAGHKGRTWINYLTDRISVPSTNIYFNLFVSAARYPRKAAIIDERGQLSYADLLAQVDRLACYLESDIGLRPGERVLFYLQNSREFVAAYFAVLRLQGVVVLVNPMNMKAEVAHILLDSEPRAAFSEAHNVGELIAAQGDAAPLPVIVLGWQPSQGGDGGAMCSSEASQASIVAYDVALARDGEPASSLQHNPSDLAVILYSSGTTGAPKGCMHTHGSLMASTVTAHGWMGMQSEIVVLAALPFFHITGMQHLMNAPIFGGGTLVLMARWDRVKAVELISQHRVTHWNAATTMVIDFLDTPGLQKQTIASMVRLGGGGAGMPEAVSERIKATLGMDYLEGYGLSEGMPLMGNTLSDFKRQCLGIPLFDVDARIIDPDRLTELLAGEMGEIVVRGPQLFSGYWRQPQATRDAFIDIAGERFFRTGDLGHQDSQGYFFITDRMKRMINAAGYKVWPTEVEALLHEHPDIKEACVVAKPDAYRGETVKAFVVLHPGAQGRIAEADVIAWCKSRMAAYKYPRHVEFLGELPKLATGKLAWRLLQEQEVALASKPA